MWAKITAALAAFGAALAFGWKLLADARKAGGERERLRASKADSERAEDKRRRGNRARNDPKFLRPFESAGFDDGDGN